MTKTLLLSFVLTGFTLFSQKNDLVSAWIQKNQDVLFIESSNFANFTDAEKEKLGSRIIIFTNEIKESDIVDFETKFGIVNFDNLDVNTKESSKEQSNPKVIIANWLDSHSNVKIVTQSEFKSVDIVAQEEYISNKCLILAGENITVEDIKNYNY